MSGTTSQSDAFATGLQNEHSFPSPDAAGTMITKGGSSIGSAAGGGTCPAAVAAQEANSPCSLWNQATWGVSSPCTPGSFLKNCNGLYRCNDDGAGVTSIDDRPAVGDVSKNPDVKFPSNEEAVTGGMGILGSCASRAKITFDQNSEKCYGSDQPGDFRVDFCTGPMSQAALDRSNDRTQQALANLDHLQRMERDLYNTLEKLNANDAAYSEQQKVMKKVNQVADMRISLFQGLRDMYSQTQEDVAQTRVDLVDQLTVLGVVNAELDSAKAQLAELEDARAGKVRMAEINTYYGKRYRAHAELMKLIVIVCLPILIVVVLQKRGTISSKIANPLLAVIIGIGIILVGLRIWDLAWRNNMNYDEYDWEWDPDAHDPTVIEYDIKEWKKSDVGRTILKGVEHTVDEIGKELDFCVGSHCCGPNTYYNHKKARCVEGDGSGDLGADGDATDDGSDSSAVGRARRGPASERIVPASYRAIQRSNQAVTAKEVKAIEGFDTQYLTQKSYVADPSPVCRWRAEKSIVKPYSPQDLAN